jgi:adenine deaminase
LLQEIMMDRHLQIPASTLARRIAAGRGLSPADRVIRNIRLFDLITGVLEPAEISIVGDVIVSTALGAEGLEVIDGDGLIAVPGFIDPHLHVESSLVTPFEFEACVLPHGVTTAICDPHEIANVLGATGIRYFLDCTEQMVMDLRVQLSSCVPATHLETSGAVLDADDLASFMNHPKVIGLAEFMNFPGVLAGDAHCLAKLSAFSHRHIDGHAPLLSGRDLDGYICAGISTDHECTSLIEAREKLSKGMHILIREGSVSKDLAALQPLIDIFTAPFLSFCTDDRNPLDIAEEGHIDHMIRTAIAKGACALAVYRVATLSAARVFGLNDRGLLAPGKRADIVLIDDLASCNVKRTFVAGREVNAARLAERRHVTAVGHDSIKMRLVSADDFGVAARSGPMSVIGVVPGQIITNHLKLALPAQNGSFQIDLTQDVIKVSVLERHGHSLRNSVKGIAVGFVHGFGMQRGAIASSVGHDSHNICVVGASDHDMALAVNRLAEIGGGFCVVDAGIVVAELPLPLAGLISERPFEEVRMALETLRHAAKRLGVTLAEPFLQVAFLTLPVIPHLKITDKGLVDVDRFELLFNGP